jgi:hypothetical protein
LTEIVTILRRARLSRLRSVEIQRASGAGSLAERRPEKGSPYTF